MTLRAWQFLLSFMWRNQDRILFHTFWIYYPSSRHVEYTRKEDVNWNFSRLLSLVPITAASRSKAWTVFARSNTGIVSTNPTQGMDVCVLFFCVYILCVGSGLATGWSPIQGVLPTVYRIKKLIKRPRSTQRTVEPQIGRLNHVKVKSK
jgi:hypothetical protein